MQVVADFEKLDEILQDDHVGPHYDLAFIVLGTTRAQAGSDVRRRATSVSCRVIACRKPSSTSTMTTR